VTVLVVAAEPRGGERIVAFLKLDIKGRKKSKGKPKKPVPQK
jgi:hypothetical protein